MTEIAGLIAKWIPEISEEEKSRIYQELTKFNNGLFSVDIGAIQTDDPKRILKLVSNMIGIFHRKKDYTISRKISLKGEQIAPKCSDVITCHFFYMHMIKMFYKMRDEIPEALENAIEYCKRQIEISSTVAMEMKSEFKGGLPNHTGYEQLAIIYEKKGEYDLALDLCNKAYLAGWGEGATNPASRQNWGKRIEKLQAQKSKVNKEKIPKENSQDFPSSDPNMLKIPCPHCRSVLNVPIKYAGTRGTCKHCNGVLVVPDIDEM